MTLQTSTYHDGTQTYTSPWEHASALLRFPNLSLKACLFGFQGLLFESLALLRRDDRTAVEAVVGAAGLLCCLGMLVFTQVWGVAASHEQEEALSRMYVPYTHVMTTLPLPVRFAFLPDGFWFGTHLFVRKFGALFDTFEARHLRWVASVHLVRATLIGVLSAVKPDDVSGCRAIYYVLTVVFAGFALLFLATRPHRAPFDDFIAVFLNLCSGLLALSVAADVDTINKSALYLFIVYAALASVVVSVTLLVAEMLFLRKKELAARKPADEDADDAGDGDAADVVDPGVDAPDNASNGLRSRSTSRTTIANEDGSAEDADDAHVAAGGP